MSTRLLLAAFVAVMANTLIHAQGPFRTDLVEGEIYVADRGIMNNGSDGEVRRYAHTGQLLGTFQTAGTGQIRGIGVDHDNNVYVARGDEIIRYLAPGHTPDPMPFAMGQRAQDIAVSPITGNIWCSFGVNSGQAMVQELDTAGTLLNTFTDPLFDHPRSMDFSPDGSLLYVANATPMGNVLVIDPNSSSTTFGDVSIYSNFAGVMGGFSPISVTVTSTGAVYVGGDYALANNIFRITGPPGNSSAVVFSDFSMTPGLNAPGGLHADNHGSLYVAGRDQNMGTPGIYRYNLLTGNLTPNPLTGTEHRRTIDIAFEQQSFTVSFDSPDGLDSNGVPLLRLQTITGTSSPVSVRVQAPNFPSRPYAFLMSLLSATECASGPLLLPPLGGVTLAPGEPRTMPLNLDAFFLATQEIVRTQSGPIDVSALPNCPGSSPGFGTLFNGVTDTTGTGVGILQMPTLPCIPLGVTFYFGVAAVIIDGTTAPFGIGLMTPIPGCLAMEVVP